MTQQSTSFIGRLLRSRLNLPIRALRQKERVMKKKKKVLRLWLSCLKNFCKVKVGIISHQWTSILCSHWWIFPFRKSLSFFSFDKFNIVLRTILTKVALTAPVKRVLRTPKMVAHLLPQGTNEIETPKTLNVDSRKRKKEGQQTPFVGDRRTQGLLTCIKDRRSILFYKILLKNCSDLLVRKTPHTHSTDTYTLFFASGKTRSPYYKTIIYSNFSTKFFTLKTFHPV